MNPIDGQLDRLFRGAREGTHKSTPPFGMETRVLAAWRESRVMGLWNSSLLARGLLAALGIMLVSVLPVLFATTNPARDYLKLADATVQANEIP